ncbi:hypothetical protein CYMTET_35634 [Cymbomonas tetramitiformis]|uniref:DNA-directed DNA polymerase n=1 Tax=Cymbomonas tetramitiformis TaxID=36881 RepID=A0AAE0F8U1_9CHLO|nr:hypothetical protein CYMTET_35634 [Cymbomonas tetramitiformis]
MKEPEKTILALRFDVLENDLAGASAKRKVSRSEGRHLRVRGVRHEDGEKVDALLSLRDTFLLKAVYVVREDAHLHAIERRMRDEHDASSFRWTSVPLMLTTDHFGLSDGDDARRRGLLRKAVGFEVRADAPEAFRALRATLEKMDDCRPIRCDASDASVVQAFFEGRSLRPYTWWKMRESGDFEQEDMCPPSVLARVISVATVRAMGGVNGGAIRAVHISLMTPETMDALVERQPRTCECVASTANEERDLLNRTVVFLETAKVDVIVSDDAGALSRAMERRARAHGLPDVASRLRSAFSILHIKTRRATRAGVEAYATKMGIRKDEESVVRSTDETRSFWSDSALYARALTERRLPHMELFLHSVAFRIVDDESSLLVTGDGVKGVFPHVQRAYHRSAERMSPPQYLTAENALPSSERLMGGYNLPPSVGVHRTGTAVLDFQSFYPSCMLSFNIGKGMVRTDPPDAECEHEWVRLNPLHIGDETSDRCDCCARGTFDPKVSRNPQRLRLAGRDMRVWRNDSSEGAFYVRSSSFARSPVNEILRSWMQMRQEMKRRGEGEAERICKTLANSLNGMLGHVGKSDRSRHNLYDAAAFNATVSLGRSLLLRAAVCASDLGLRPVYGDTDSLFVSADAGGVPNDVIDRLNERVRIEEMRPRLIDREEDFSVHLRLVERHSGARAIAPVVTTSFFHFAILSMRGHVYADLVIFAKKRYASRVSADQKFALCGFSKSLDVSKALERDLLEHCLSYALSRVADEFAPIAALNDFLVRRAALGRPRQLSRSVKDAIWDVVDKTMGDKICATAYLASDWRRLRALARRMIDNHFFVESSEGTSGP